MLLVTLLVMFSKAVSQLVKKAPILVENSSSMQMSKKGVSLTG